jgi:hypothetical protein
MTGQSSLRGRDIAWRSALALGFYTLIATAMFWPLIAHLSAVLIGPPEDNLQDFWNSWYAAVAADPRHFFDTTLIRFPEGTALNFHSFAYPQVFAVALLSRLFGAGHDTLVLLQNLTLLSSFPLAGLGAFWLVRHFTGHDAGSLAGGFVFAFNPSHVAHVMHHAHVSQIEFIPFFALAWILTVERKSYSWLAAAIVLFALNALSCWYYIFYMAFFIVFHTIYLRVRDDELPKGWRLFAPLAAFAGVTALLLPLLLPMFALSGSHDIYYGGSNIFVADFAALFAFPPTHLLGGLSKGLYARVSGSPWEAAVYLGLVNLALVIWLCIRAKRRKEKLPTYALSGMIAFCIIAGGDTLHVAGIDFSRIHLPGILFSHIPFLADVRTPSRAIVLAYLFLAIGVGQALAALEQSLRGRLAGIAVAGIVVLMAIDFYPAHLSVTAAACPAGMDVIRADPERGFSVLNLPRGYVEANEAMFLSTCHNRPVLHGIVARILKPSLIDRLDVKNAAAAKRKLMQARVKYIILDGCFPWDPADGTSASYLGLYRTVFRSPDIAILRVY